MTSDLNAKRFNKAQESIRLAPQIIFWVFNATILIMCFVNHILPPDLYEPVPIPFFSYAIIGMACITTLSTHIIPTLILKVSKPYAQLPQILSTKGTALEEEAALAELPLAPQHRQDFAKLSQREKIEYFVRINEFGLTVMRLAFSESVTLFGLVLDMNDPSTAITILPFALVSLALNFFYTLPKLSDENIGEIVSEIETRVSMNIQ